MLANKEAIIIPARGCKFITGHPGESGWEYCGKPLADQNSSWCEEHRAVVYGKAKPKVAEKSETKEAEPSKVTAITRPTNSLEDPLLLS